MVYVINIVLSVFAIYKAEEIRHPKLLWAEKTFAEVRIEFYHLPQFPNLQEINGRNPMKGIQVLR